MIKFTNNKILLILLSGAFAGLSTFTHLNGVIYSFAGAVLLLIYKQYKPMLLFSVAAGVFSLLYFIDIHSVEALQILKFQFFTHPDIAERMPFYLGIVEEHKRFFHSPKEVSISLMLIFSLLFGFKQLKTQFGAIMLYLLLLMVGLATFTHGVSYKYGLHYFPYVAIIIVAGYTHIFREKQRIVKCVGAFLVLCFVAVHGFYNEKLIEQRMNLAAHNAQIATYMPHKNVQISPPPLFIFNEIDNYTVHSEYAWTIHHKFYESDKPYNLETYLTFAASQGNEYVVLDKQLSFKGAFQWAVDRGLNENDELVGYRVKRKTDKWFVLERISDNPQ